jgi:RND family efflux transporter MFP subunit
MSCQEKLKTAYTYAGGHKKKIALIVFCVILSFSLYQRYFAKKDTAVAIASTRVQVTKAKYDDKFVSGLDTTTSLRAVSDVIIKSKVDTYVKKIYLQKGQSFHQGDLLLELDHASQSAQVLAAKAQISMNQAAAESAKYTLKNAAHDQARYDILIAKGYTTRQEVESKRTNASTAQADYNKAVSNIAYAEAQLNEAEASLHDYYFTAPFNGVVLDDYNMSVSSKVAPETSVLRIADISTIKAAINIPEQQLQNIKDGMEATITCDSLPGQKFLGKVRNINPFVDTDTHTVQADIYIDNAAYNYALKPGMFARIFVVEKEENKALTIPSEAISKDNTVQLVRDNKVNVIKVTPGLSYNKKTAVTGDLQAGDLIITSGGNSLQDGDAVTYNEEN